MTLYIYVYKTIYIINTYIYIHELTNFFAIPIQYLQQPDVCVCACACVRVWVYVLECVRACMSACVRACVCVRISARGQWS